MSEMHRYVRGGQFHPPLRRSLDDYRNRQLWQALSRAHLRTPALVFKSHVDFALTTNAQNLSYRLKVSEFVDLPTCEFVSRCIWV